MSVKYIDVIDNPNMKRDSKTGAILINDDIARQTYLKRKEKQQQFEQRIDKLEQGMDEILNLLKQLTQDYKKC